LNEADKGALRRILEKVPAPKTGLPDAVFDFALAIVPMINVDLLVSDDANRVLLAWREDRWGSGWHVPGGIIRAYESLSERIAITARRELGAKVNYDPVPESISQFFSARGHFISILYKCSIDGDESAVINPDKIAAPQPNYLAWFSKPPSVIYPAHEQYIPRLPQFATSRKLTFGEAPIEQR
jgi:ADP-ribose pyrophosphatase YjhB (NUDIX family)